jgi:hypothetical protein
MNCIRKEESYVGSCDHLTGHFALANRLLPLALDMLTKATAAAKQFTCLLSSLLHKAIFEISWLWHLPNDGSCDATAS